MGVVAQFAQSPFDFLQRLANDLLGRLDISREKEGESVELRKSGVWEERGLQDGDSYRWRHGWDKWFMPEPVDLTGVNS